MRIIYLLTIALLFVSCNKDVTLNLPDPELKPTIYSYPTSGKLINLSLTKSYPITTNDDVLDASINTPISLFVNSIFQEELLFSNGQYTSLYKPKQGDNISIELNYENTSISANTTIPENIIIDSFLYTYNSFIDDEGWQMSEINLHFTDNPNQDNYYETLICHNLYNDTTNLNVKEYTFYYQSSDPVLIHEEMFHYEPRSLLFTDELFLNAEASVTFAFDGLFLDEGVKYINTTVYLLRVTKDYYQYKQSLYKHLFIQNPTIWDAAHEPVSVLTNVGNGYGLFAAYSIDSAVFVIR